jgi:hypothetical protein
MKTIYIIFILFIPLCYNCSHRTTISTNDKIEIPKYWIELVQENQNWVYLIPCKNERDLQSIEVKKLFGKEVVSWVSGTEGQWYEIKQIQQTKDSLMISTVLPYDTTANILFVFKYIDKARNIGTWKIFEGNDSSYEQTFVPIEDTVKFKRVQDECDKK